MKKLITTLLSMILLITIIAVYSEHDKKDISKTKNIHASQIHSFEAMHIKQNEFNNTDITEDTQIQENENTMQSEENFQGFSEEEFAEIDFLTFFEDVLNYSADDLDDEFKKSITQKYLKANEIYSQSDYPTREYLSIHAEINQSLRQRGYQIPLQSLVDAAEFLKPKLSNEEYTTLLTLSDKSLKTYNKDELLTDSVIGDKIIAKYGLSTKELLKQSGNASIQMSLYKVDQTNITKNHMDTVIDSKAKKDIDPIHQKIWNKIITIIPQKYLSKINSFEISNDGYGNTTAFVEKHADNEWNLSIDSKDFFAENDKYSQESIRTIIHEMAHIIALNNEQMTETNKDTNLYTVDEGTLKKDAYLNKFYHRFWAKYKNQDESSTEETTDISNEFVTEYAATDPIEDFAESFAHFVTTDKPKDTSIKSQKILFFYQFPELVIIRQNIRLTLHI